MLKQMNELRLSAFECRSKKHSVGFAPEMTKLSAKEMADSCGGNTIIEFKTNTVLIGIGIGAVVGFMIGGPAGAMEGAFWGGLLWLLLP